MKIFNKSLITKVLFVSFIIVSVLASIAGFWLPDKYVVPIMMYHKVEDSETLKSDTVSPENFQKHMAYLKNHGYRVLTLDEFVEGVKHDRMFPEKSVVLTFDDGYENNFLHAFPVLQQNQFPATLFISPEFIGREGFLTWRQIYQMQAHDISYGSHGMTQAYLPDLNEHRRRYEIEESKAVLEGNLSTRIDYFAYPVGGFNDDIKKRLQTSGYRAAMATNRGYDRFNKDVFEINRIRFSDKDNSGFILWAKLSGYYNLFRTLKHPE